VRPAEDERQHIVQLLQKHGVPENTAQLVVPAGEALRREAARLGAERAASFDIETGQAVGPGLTGRGAEVDIGPQIRSMRADRAYVSIHTHAMSASFSDRDADVLLSNHAIRNIVAVGADGTWHALSKQPGIQHADAAKAVAAFGLAFAALAPDYLALARSGAVSREEALRRLVDAIWRYLAPRLGLRYDRSR
jgi:hypothetical protein